jgi:hypothetical protein
MTTSTQGIVFIHGINQDEKALVGMQDWVEDRLSRFSLIDQFYNHDGSLNVWCAKWRSLGNFVHDLEDLFRHRVRREQAVQDIQKVIRSAWDTLGASQQEKRGLLVLAHSMGQPLAVAALHGLQGQPTDNQPQTTYPVPTSLLSVGGPLGNDNPVFRRYLSYGADGSEWVRAFCPRKPTALKSWVDVFNPLDPVCHDLVVGSSTYPGANHVVFKVPNQPHLPMPFSNPIADYHSAYFRYPEVYRLAAQMLEELVR